MKPIELQKTEEALNKFQVLSKKSAQKLALEIAQFDFKQIKALVEQLNKLIDKIVLCQECGILTNQNVCQICQSQNRENILLIMAYSQDCWHLEENGFYKGKYHILNGEIDASKKIFWESLNINNLVSRAEHFQEIIIGTNPTIYGELTARYIIKLLSPLKKRISKLATGMPIGAHIDYLDKLTLKNAFINRVKSKDE